MENNEMLTIPQAAKILGVDAKWLKTQRCQDGGSLTTFYAGGPLVVYCKHLRCWNPSLSVTQAAEATGKDARALRRYCEQERLKAEVLGHSWSIKLKDLLRFVKSQSCVVCGNLIRTPLESRKNQTCSKQCREIKAETAAK